MVYDWRVYQFPDGTLRLCGYYQFSGLLTGPLLSFDKDQVSDGNKTYPLAAYSGSLDRLGGAMLAIYLTTNNIMSGDIKEYTI